MDDWLPPDHLVRFVADLVDEVLDLGPVLADYTDKRGHPPYPRLMLRLLIYGYTTVVRSSRAIERKCADDIAFRFLATDQASGFRSISRLRRHPDALAALFTQSLHLAQKLGMVEMGRVALAGTTLEANASKHKAMSFGRLADEEERIEAEPAAPAAQAAALLTETEAADTAEHGTFGIDDKNTDLPADLDRREKRPARRQAARAQLGRSHRQGPPPRRGKGTPQPGARRASDEQAVTDARQQAAAKVRPKPMAQVNFTDPDSRIMNHSDGACIQAYKAQAAVGAEHQVITAVDVTTNPSDPLNCTTMLDQSAHNTGVRPKQARVDTG